MRLTAWWPKNISGPCAARSFCRNDCRNRARDLAQGGGPWAVCGATRNRRAKCRHSARSYGRVGNEALAEPWGYSTAVIPMWALRRLRIRRDSEHVSDEAFMGDRRLRPCFEACPNPWRTPSMVLQLRRQHSITCMRTGSYQTKKGLSVFFGSLWSRKSMTLVNLLV